MPKTDPIQEVKPEEEPADPKKEALKNKNLKEQMYDKLLEKVPIPVWLLDVIIVAAVIALFAVILIGRSKGGA